MMKRRVNLLALSVVILALAVFISAVFVIESSRDSRRAFYTAPPVIPHELEDQFGDECLDCHSEVMEVDDAESIVTPHPEMSNCLQCHVTEIAPLGATARTVENSFKGLAEPKAGFRAHDKAPPVIPHRKFLRENCIACHSPETPRQELRLDHSHRSNCLQCHTFGTGKEFVPESRKAKAKCNCEKCLQNSN